MEKVNIRAASSSLDEFWRQKAVGQANGSLFKVAKGIGSTNWHKHDDEDEVFFVYKGCLTIQLRTENVELSEGDMFIVPRGVEHCPRADDEVHLLLVGSTITSNREGGKPDWSYK